MVILVRLGEKEAMKAILGGVETPYIDAQTLLTLLHEYSKPRDWIRRMVKKGELIRLKNGFYLIAEKIKEGGVPYEQVANLLYGPSYVSLEWALSFYGMIPERVHTVTSMTFGREKEYHTPIGDFIYHPLHSLAYSVGVEQKKAVNSVGSFLMASPEKALADWVFKTCKGLKKEELKIDLLESKRLDREHLLHLDKELLSSIARSYRSKVVRFLSELLGGI